MKNIFIFITILFAVSIFAEKRDENEVVSVNKKDPDMVQAIKEAQATLDGFLKKFSTNPTNVQTYKLKVVLTDKYGDEHFWVTPFRQIENGSFEGVLANEPKLATTFKSGQIVSFKKPQITDWGYVENGKQFGSYTVCVLFKKMPKEQADYYRNNHGFQC